MLTHKDFDFDSMRSKTLGELTKEEKEYLSKYVSMKIPNQFYQYVVSYSEVNKNNKYNRIIDIYPTFGEAFDDMISYFNKVSPSSLQMYTFENEEDSDDRTFYYDIILFSKKYCTVISHYKVTIERRLATFWPETKFVTYKTIEKIKGVLND
ncbi:MAG: hypothetical protein SO179_07675 [Bacteroidales bacterium]|nr:hypothetical protein [Bacteroidales bacterium]